MILYGAGGHGKVIADIIRQSDGEEVLFVDQNPSAQVQGYSVINSLSADRLSEPVIVAIGNNSIRKKVVSNLSANYAKAIHPTSCIALTKVEIGVGTVIMAGAVVNPFTYIGAHCIINTNSSIDHDCVIGDFAHISPGVTLCGGVSVGEGSHIGAGAVVIPNVKIGNWVVIGAGSTVIENVPDYAFAVGSPAKIIKFNYQA